MRGSELVAQLLEADAGGHGESADVIAQARLLGRDEVAERSTGIAAVLLRLLSQEVKMLQHLGPGRVGVQLDVVADGVGRKQAVHAARRDQLLLDDHVEQRVALGEDLARLLAVLFVLEDARVDALSAPRCGRTASSR